MSYYLLMAYCWHHGIRQAGNLVSVEEQQVFASDTASFLKTVAKYHLYHSIFLTVMLFGWMFVILKWKIFTKISDTEYSWAIKLMVGIITDFAALCRILKLSIPLINVYLRYLFIGILLSLFGLGKRMMLMFFLNFFGCTLFGNSSLFITGLPWRWRKHERN